MRLSLALAIKLPLSKSSTLVGFRKSHLKNIAIVGLGYVGIPLAVEFGKILPTIGFDISKDKIDLLKKGRLPGDEISEQELALADKLEFTSDPAALLLADYILIAVPTLVSEAHQPDFGPLKAASNLVGRHMKKGAVIIYESTVYPGATEEICIPELELASGMRWKQDFYVGYSPERVNPGDTRHTLTKIIKIVSGDMPETLNKIAALYELIIQAGVHRASSIKVAEAAKVIENTQRDLNIALMNELAIISHLVGIDTQEVIDAAATKWNFSPAYPGLVGGHCISVVPYYLTSKAEQLGYRSELILTGRKINDSMAKFIADQAVKQMIAADIKIKGAHVNILGLAFKEDVQDLRNSKIVDVIKELKLYGIHVHIHDPLARKDDAKHRYDIDLQSWDELPVGDVMIIAVPHRDFLLKPLPVLLSKLEKGGCFMDLHASYESSQIEVMGFKVWRL